MLSQTIRMLSLLGMIAIAHTMRPFSLENVSNFAVGAAHSLVSLLPEETIENLAEARTLAALVTGGTDGNKLLANRFTQQRQTSSLVRQSKLIAQRKVIGQSTLLGKRLNTVVKRTGQMEPRGVLQARNKSNQFAVPLPLIPGVAVRMLPNVAIMALPQLSEAAPEAMLETTNQAFGSYRIKQELPGAVCEQFVMSERIARRLEELRINALNATANGSDLIKVQLLKQRIVNGQACQQPTIREQRAPVSGKQSC